MLFALGFPAEAQQPKKVYRIGYLSGRLVVIGGGTHGVMMEKNRMQLFNEVQLFLDEPATGP